MLFEPGENNHNDVPNINYALQQSKLFTDFNSILFKNLIFVKDRKSIFLNIYSASL
jgi:hypothetical protein